MILVGISDFSVTFEASRLRVSLMISSKETDSNKEGEQTFLFSLIFKILGCCSKFVIALAIGSSCSCEKIGR